MVEEALRLEQVTKVMQNQTILQPVDLTLKRGRILALCGGNGAGKSTLLRMIAGISKPSKGRVRVAGLEWKQDRKAYANRIGYMPDDFQFGNALSAQETLLFYASLRGVPRQRAMQLLRAVGLEQVLHKPVSAFSKGMRQRLLFAQSMLAKPPLLVLDEPTNGLDPYWTEAFAELVKKARSEGQSVVFSTHQLNVAEEVADQVVFLDEGHVRFCGEVSHLQRKFGMNGLGRAFAFFVGRAPRNEAEEIKR